MKRSGWLSALWRFVTRSLRPLANLGRLADAGLGLSLFAIVALIGNTSGVGWAVAAALTAIVVLLSIGGARQEYARSLFRISFAPHAPEQRGADSWKVTIGVANEGSTARLHAQCRKTVAGITEQDYGDFDLAWEGETQPVLTLEGGWTRLVHAAHVTTNPPSIAFVGPESAYAPGSQTGYPAKTVIDPSVEFVLEVRDVDRAVSMDATVRVEFSKPPTVTVMP